MPPLGIDLDTHAWFEAQRTDWLDARMLDVTAAGSIGLLTLVSLFTIGLLLALRYYRTAGFVVGAVLIGLLVSNTTKDIVGRARPARSFWLMQRHLLVADPDRPDEWRALSSPLREEGPSFPSGHSLNSSVVYLTLALLVTPLLPRRNARGFVIGAALVLVLLIGISRLYLGVHWLTDVLAGWAFGLTWAVLCRLLEKKWILRRGKPSVQPPDLGS